MTEKKDEKYKRCIFFKYKRYCCKFYGAEKQKYGYADLTDYPCKKEKCKDVSIL